MTTPSGFEIPNFRCRIWETRKKL